VGGHGPQDKNVAGNGFYANGSAPFRPICWIPTCDVPRQLTADRLARSGWTRGGLAARLGLGDGHMGHPSPRVIYIYICY
jgi:hypothetical protein